jgi:tRNA threonylcarbamoyladenosine biosynthesis protein TsaB
MIDARRGEVYWSIYQRTHSGLVERCAAQAGSADQVFKILNEPCLFIGNGAQRYAQALAAASNHGISFAGDELNTLRAGTLARLGLQRFDEGMSDDPQRLGPIYVRPSDAQLSHEPGRLV